MSAFNKVRDYAIDNSLTVTELRAMSKSALVAAAGLVQPEPRRVWKAVNRLEARRTQTKNDNKIDNILTRIQAGTLQAKPAATLEWIEPGVSFHLELNDG
ncbi:MAG: hypothetical protein GY934_09010 [Gammaproteobacteria bacterium]|nr:hypothetical protein [Gammaproteobacteria bacterium]